MKFEALILRVLCAGSMLVCVLVLGNMLLARPVLSAPTDMVASTTQCTATANGLPNQPGVAKPEHG